MIRRPDRTVEIHAGIRRRSSRGDSLILLGWRIGTLTLLVLNGSVALAVPLISLVVGRLPPSGASRSWVYETGADWPTLVPPSFPWWLAAAGAAVFTWAWVSRASARVRRAWGIPVTVSWLVLGGFSSIVGGLYFRDTPAWPHDIMWSGFVVMTCAIVVGTRSFGRAVR